jgi:hypothetical protein
MKKFTASRLAEGEHLFPSEIILESKGLTIKISGIFNNKEEYFDYDKISNVSIETPMVGYSTITFHAANSRVSAHGFTKDDVKQIKKAIQENT